MFGRDPLCRRSAWAWLIEEAAWKETRVGFGGKSVTLKRGQLSHSLRHMAEAWHWKKDAVARYLARLEAEGMIATNSCRASVAVASRLTETKTASATQSQSGQLVITICNYNTYQAEPKGNETATATVDETPPRQDRDTTATTLKEDKEVKKEEDISARKPEADYLKLIRVLDDAVADVYGPARRRMFPHPNDEVFGNRMLATGADVDLISGVIRTVVAQFHNDGDDPPKQLKIFEKWVSGALKARNAPQVEARYVNGSRTAKSPRPSLDDQFAELDRLGAAGVGPLEPFGDSSGGTIIDQPEQRH